MFRRPTAAPAAQHAAGYYGRCGGLREASRLPAVKRTRAGGVVASKLGDLVGRREVRRGKSQLATYPYPLDVEGLLPRVDLAHGRIR